MMFENTLNAVLSACCFWLVYEAGQRVNLFSPRRHKFGWGLMYFAWACGFFGLGLAMLFDTRLLAESSVALGVGAALNLLLTFEQWRFNVTHNGAVEGDVPPIAKKGYRP